MTQRVLIIEDEPQNQYLISFILRKAGYEVTEAASGEDGVKLVNQKTPDLILMDIKLPGIDGYEATERIRSTKAGMRVPIIALTSYAMKGDRERAFAAGCNGYIEKPIDPATIVDEIGKHLAKGKG